ncbi:hypothetical protein WJX81_001542 [Elliptochloris bilobata]|uniref:SRPBCC family protein n=1 Tax=Elliptochloris bilobata TaxID=381761 RepID=A0AAW1QYA2_9CHLO
MAKHVFEVKAHVLAAPNLVFNELKSARNFEALFSAVRGLSPQATGEFGGRCIPAVLFMREDLHLKILEAAAPERFTVQLTDEYNVVTYAFSIAAAGKGSAVACRVECCTRSESGASWPSERLARMMQRQDGAIAERLKDYVERAGVADARSVSVC